VSAWQALFWGGISSATLYIGELLAGPMAKMHRITGLVMGFGAGTLLSAVAYELLPDSSLDQGARVALGFGSGALVYFLGDRVIDRRGGDDRQNIADADADSSGPAMFLGALLDGLPEAFVLGIGIHLGGQVSVAFVAAVAVSNVP
jgi:ZIP family zinc transporter